MGVLLGDEVVSDAAAGVVRGRLLVRAGEDPVDTVDHDSMSLPFGMLRT